eukprot:835950-Lingulodinium_polyedra.AAC.1
MEKFYDNMSLWRCLRMASELGFPAVPLAMEALVHIAPRVLSAGQAATAPQVVSNSILPGTRFANSLARAFLYSTMKKVTEANPRATLEQFYDDVVVQTIGEDVNSTAEIHVEATSQLHEQLKELRCVISSKSQCTGSHPELRRELTKRCKEKGVKLK